MQRKFAPNRTSATEYFRIPAGPYVPWWLRPDPPSPEPGPEVPPPLLLGPSGGRGDALSYERTVERIRAQREEEDAQEQLRAIADHCREMAAEDVATAALARLPQAGLASEGADGGGPAAAAGAGRHAEMGRLLDDLGIGGDFDAPAASGAAADGGGDDDAGGGGRYICDAQGRDSERYARVVGGVGTVTVRGNSDQSSNLKSCRQRNGGYAGGIGMNSTKWLDLADEDLLAYDETSGIMFLLFLLVVEVHFEVLFSVMVVLLLPQCFKNVCASG